VERVASLTGRSPDDFQVIVEAGTPHVEIVRTAEAEGAALVVVGARGSSGLMRALVGHSAEKVARFAHCAVLVVRPGASSGQILVATDLSAGADVAVRRAAALAEGRGATLTTMHVIDTAMPFPMDAGVSTSAMVSTQLMRQHAATELRAHLDALGVRSEVTIADGPVVDSMVRVARTLPAELVVVGTIGRTGLARVTLGNTAEAAIREVPCSVLVVRVDGATPR
jgi:nucleotide-binding universal stress UspA family protein